MLPPSGHNNFALVVAGAEINLLLLLLLKGNLYFHKCFGRFIYLQTHFVTYSFRNRSMVIWE